jgi:Predicted membrane protein (DUF2306)
MLKSTVYIARYFFIYLILCVATFLMLRIIADYTSFRDDVAFLRFKQEYLGNTVWKTAFYIHVFSSIFALLAGFTQFSDYLLKNYRKLHRFVGRTYAWDVLLINFPAGMIMAVYANGHMPTKIAFVVLDSLWFWFTYKAVIAAKQKRFTEHKEYMIRSYALTFSAITLRTWKLILSNSFQFDPITLYMIDAWMGFVPNLLFAEWLIRRMRNKKSRIISARS